MVTAKPAPGNSDLLPITMHAKAKPQGWGYEILVDGKLFIRQDYIPAIAGRQDFSNKKGALFVAEMAVKKLKKGKLPVITMAELQQWGYSETGPVLISVNAVSGHT